MLRSAADQQVAARSLDDVTPADLDRVRTERLSATVKGKGKRAVTPATVNREFSFLKHVLNLAIWDGKTEKNPVARLTMLRGPSGRVRYLSDDEETRLMGKLATEEDRQRVTVLTHTGLRKTGLQGSHAAGRV